MNNFIINNIRERNESTDMDPLQRGSAKVPQAIATSSLKVRFILFVSYQASPNGQQAYLVYESTFDVTEQLIRLVVAPTKATILRQLSEGTLSVEQALDQPTVWAVDQGFDGSVRRVVLLTEGLHSVPDGFKPEPRIRLQPDHHYAT
ncbi:hypothetical protein [Burkholderia ubonensis]|uniref:hypothetical protein n=1 Tax=Burkholderia ubonensis TaxID=101571 RepID=UPI0012FC70B9|nr:hypothetical protein [Burkholderia ubonensis]